MYKNQSSTDFLYIFKEYFSHAHVTRNDVKCLDVTYNEFISDIFNSSTEVK